MEGNGGNGSSNRWASAPPSFITGGIGGQWRLFCNGGFGGGSSALRFLGGGGGGYSGGGVLGTDEKGTAGGGGSLIWAGFLPLVRRCVRNFKLSYRGRKRGPPLLSSVVSSTKTRNAGKSRE